MIHLFLTTFLNQEGFCYFMTFILVYLLSTMDTGSNTIHMPSLHDIKSLIIIVNQMSESESMLIL